MTSHLNLDALRAVLAAYGHPAGIEGGSFSTPLIQAAQHADRENLDRLARAFPEYGVPVRLAKLASGGIDTLAAAVALMLDGLEVRARDIDAVGPADQEPSHRAGIAKAAWLHQDVLGGMTVEALLEREHRLANREPRPALRIVSDRRRADGAAGTSRKPR